VIFAGLFEEAQRHEAWGGIHETLGPSVLQPEGSRPSAVTVKYPSPRITRELRSWLFDVVNPSWSQRRLWFLNEAEVVQAEELGNCC